MASHPAACCRAVAGDREAAYRRAAPWLASLLARPKAAASFRALPFFDDLVARHAERGIEGLVTMPPEWWAEIGAIGTLDDAAAHVDALEAAGTASIGLFPAPNIAMAQLDDVLTLARR